MIRRLKYQYNLWKLHRRQRQRARYYSLKIEEAGRQGDNDQVRKWADEHKKEQELLEDEISVLAHTYLVHLADRRVLPRPRFEGEFGSTWVTDRYGNRVYLSREAMAELKAMIRKDTKERHEMMLPWLTLLIGLVGALTGLIAVIGAMP